MHGKRSPLTRQMQIAMGVVFARRNEDEQFNECAAHFIADRERMYAFCVKQCTMHV